MNNILSGKVAVITGATGGLGACIAAKLIEEGCDLRLISSQLGKVETFARRLKAQYPERSIEHYSADFRNLVAVQELIQLLGSKVDATILINCAGVFPIKDISNSTVADYDHCFDVNVRAPFLLSQAIAENMKKIGWGRIVNLGSSSSYNGSKDPGLYCASKHALLGLSRSLHQELKEFNIRVFCVSPGSIQTDMGKTDTRQDFSSFLRPEEVAEYIVFIIKFDNELISDELRLNRVVVQ